MKNESTNGNNILSKSYVGTIGEGIACRFLVKKGYEIIERNYRKKWGEIDIIAKKDNILHFIEVKSVTRENLSHETFSRETSGYRPEDNVHPWKLKRLSRAIQTYLLDRRVKEETVWKFSVITVCMDHVRKEAVVKHLEDIVL